MSQSEPSTATFLISPYYNKLENVSQSEQRYEPTADELNYNKLENVSQSEHKL